MASKHFSSARKFAVFVAAALTLAVVQPATAQPPQPGGVPIATATPPVHMAAMAMPDTANAASIQTTDPITIFHPTDTAMNWAAHPLTFKIGKSAGYVPPVTPQYGGDGCMIVDVKLIIYAPSPYGQPCCANQNAYVDNLLAWLHAGGQWLGTGSKSICYNLVSTTVALSESPHVGGNPAAAGDIGAVMNQIMPNACTYIANNPRPVQIWALATSRGHFPEHATDGPRFDNGYHNSHNMPACSKTYTFFGYAYVGERVEGSNIWEPIHNSNMLHDHAHYLEWLMWNSARLGYPDIGCNAMNPVGNLPGYNAATDFYAPSADLTGAPWPVFSLFECQTVGLPMGPRNNFMARPTYYNGSWVGAADAHHPENIWPGPTDHPYDWSNGWGVWSHADTWWTQNYSAVTAVGCGNFGCTQEGMQVRWMQRLPGRNTTALKRNGTSHGQVVSNNHYGWWGLYWLLT